MCAARTRSDEEKMARLAKFDPMPHALRHDDCLTGFDADCPITVCLLQNHVHPTGNEVEDFVMIAQNGMNFKRMPEYDWSWGISLRAGDYRAERDRAARPVQMARLDLTGRRTADGCPRRSRRRSII